MKKLTFQIEHEEVKPSGNWNTAKNWFPEIDIEQKSGRISVTAFYTEGFQDRATVETEWIDSTVSTDGAQAFLRGEVSVRNWRNYKCSGSQKFCFAIFVGDSGHIYTHRAPATKGWMNAKPSSIKQRLRKLGIGFAPPEGTIQQGDFLLVPANGIQYSNDEFKHETLGAGHHKFEMPVLYATGNQGRQYKITEPTKLIHEAIDDIQHPTVTVPIGIYQVFTTANSLYHSNRRD